MRSWHRRVAGDASRLLTALGVMLAGCDGPGEPSSDGTLIVTTSTTGLDQDGDGYRLTLDGTDETVIAANDMVSIRLSAGSHSIALVGLAANCSVENSPRPVSMPADGLASDTVEIAFLVTCAPVEGNVWLTASTTGRVAPTTEYRVMHETFGYWDYGGPVSELGAMEPNGNLVAEVATGDHGANYWHRFRLADVPTSCSVSDPHPDPDPGFTIEDGELLKVEFVVTCPP